MKRSWKAVAAPAIAVFFLTAGSLPAQWIPCSNGSTTCTNQNVGVGTTTPALPMELRATGAGAPATSGSSQIGSFRLSNAFGDFALDFGATTNGVLWMQGVTASNLAFPARTISIQPIGGRVGIGTLTPDPAYTLDVNGSIRATSVIGAVYQDVAEWVPATETMPAGTVVVLNRAATNEVMPSHRPYDTTVAGVVSAQPGIILGQGSDTKAKIATTGRVRVRVTVQDEPIAVGDLLVTSPIAGTAMRSSPIDVGGVQIHRPGTIIGKALEPLHSGEGEILVLLTLQ
jgi:hypothetical protein